LPSTKSTTASAAKLSRNDLGQVGRSESSLGVRGQLDVQGLAQQLGRELRLVAKQQDERLVNRATASACTMALCPNSARVRVSPTTQAYSMILLPA